ncbi:MAG: MotA/TolQ/ExbB proton channel family protein [Spirochaetales bacterium]|nr:MotA/TolQ/ExbB proton channel family protein [Spirochaetales bacterium]
MNEGSLNSIITNGVLSVLAIFSIISLSIIIERFIFLARYKIHLNLYRKYIPNDISTLKQLLTAKGAGSKSSKQRMTPFDAILLSILTLPVINRAEMHERLDAKFTEVYMLYQSKVNILGIFAKLSTLLGLFGTVTGMIESFNNIVDKGVSTASIVASGISSALITTAAGLIIAIPVTFFYEYFNDKIDKEIKKMEIITSDLLSTLIDKSRERSTAK